MWYCVPVVDGIFPVQCVAVLSVPGELDEYQVVAAETLADFATIPNLVWCKGQATLVVVVVVCG
jgi:hypothetical protein